MTTDEATSAVLAREPNLGSTDVSKCLPGWIDTFVAKFSEGNGFTMSHNAVSALGHTLIAAKIRAERLVRERDEALKRIQELENVATEA